MFDTMTMTKILGAFCGALLIFLLLGWASDGLYATGSGGHGDDEHATQGYLIEVAGAESSEEAVDEGPDLATLLAAADVDKGAKVFGKCKACHKIEAGGTSTGPTLFAIVDRDIASIDGYGYSGALTALEGDWTAEALDGFLTSPKSYASGTKMTFAGLKKAKDRANLIAYLQTLSE